VRILVVDDDEVTREMLANALTSWGYEVERAENGREALGVLQRGDVRLVISDWEMPEVSGLELCRVIRGGGFNDYIYVILLTGYSGSQNIVEGMSAGADDFMSKPFNPGELLARLRAGERVLSLETRDLTIFALAKLAESRDPETGAHLERVRHYCRLLAEQLSQRGQFDGTVDANYCRLIYHTSPLHDIGKVAIPDAVLLKPGRLSDREFQIMKSHSVAGAETLEAALRQHPGAQFLRMARDIAATHHERFDGLGYPAGLTGEEIPLCGRIVALADVYDALTSKRVYKAALTHEVARSIIVNDSGTHFDPRIVEAFLAVENEFLATRQRYADEERAAA
jgi:putative two-component system response regulator